MFHWGHYHIREMWHRGNVIEGLSNRGNVTGKADVVVYRSPGLKR